MSCNPFHNHTYHYLPLRFCFWLHSKHYIFFISSLFSSVESKIKYLFTPFFFNLSVCIINKQIQRVYNVNIFTIIDFFNWDISNVVNTNVFKWFFVNFLQFWLKTFDTDHVVLKIISSIFNIYLFYYTHFIWLIFFCMIYRNILFITIHVFIVNKISNDPNADC